MKVHLAYRDRDFDLESQPPSNAQALIEDLGLDLIVKSMAAGDRDLDAVARIGLFGSLSDPDAIRYRQAVLADCLEHPDLARHLHAIAVEALTQERGYWIYSERSPESLLRRSIGLMSKYLVELRRLRDAAQESLAVVGSEGFQRLFRELIDELDDGYLGSVERVLRRLQFRGGIVLSAEMGATNLDTTYVLRRRTRPSGWRERLGLTEADSYTWQLPPRDEAGGEALEALRGRGIAQAAAALGESADHITRYFTLLRAELGFYLGCLNLHHDLAAKGEPTCFPDPVALGAGPALTARGLYDAALSLAIGHERVVGNDVGGDGRPLVVVTGANRGGKSTFLRSLGLGQLLMQGGMFVPAESFRADVRAGVFTHFKQEEDASLRSGKLDEELRRMSGIIDEIAPGALVLLNESFASTNEREGSEIAQQLVRALLEAGMKVGYVTHMFELADRLRAEHDGAGLFLRAERLPDGRRTFHVVPGDPLPTSHGQDIYRRIFHDGQPGSDTDPPTAAAPRVEAGGLAAPATETPEAAART